jgi:serpin B
MESTRANPVSAFGSALFTQLLTNKKGNVAMSPLSIWTALAMVEVASKKGSHASEQLRKLLQFDLVDGDVHKWFTEIQSTILTTDDTVKLNSANAVFATGEVSAKFLDNCQYIFSSDVMKLEKRDSINDFVYNNTDGMIPGMMSKDPDGPAVLVNAVYFNGTWTTKFDKSLTKRREFTSFDEFPVECEIVKLDYGTSQQFSAFVAVPIGKDSASMEKAVQELFGMATSWDVATKRMRQTNVKLYLPRFTVHGGVDNLKENMKEMGVTDVFESGGLPLMTDSHDAYISEVAHKAYIKVDEKGTTAAAATIVQQTRGFCHINVVKADHPFLFVVVHSVTNTMLFVARVNSIGAHA